MNSINQVVESRKNSLSGVTIDEKVEGSDPEKAGGSGYYQRKLPLTGSDNEVQDYIMRCRWLGEILSEWDFRVSVMKITV